MSRRHVRRLYKQACKDYARGIVDHVKGRQTSWLGESLNGPAYTHGYEDAKAGKIASAPISTAAWIETLALGVKRWGHRERF